ncbi:MAG: VWA domain-containing protein, partial [Candidatus Bathyarchaeia archaeon]
LKEFDQYLKNARIANQKLSDISQTDFRTRIVEDYMLKKSSSFGFSEKQDLSNFLVEYAQTPADRLTGRELKHIFRYAAKLQLNSVFMEFLHSARGSMKSSSRPLENWSMGDDFRVLSLPDTYRLFGVFIPGVSAVKRKEPTLGKLSTNIAILLDSSGSMAFENRIDLEREIGFCLIETARRGSDTVTFVPFNSDVDPSKVTTSRNYDHIEDALTSIQPYGMSNLSSALEIAIRTASVTNRQDTFIMTDGELWDVDEIKPHMQKLTVYGTTSLFLVGTTENTRKNLSDNLVSAIPNMAIYDCNIREKKVVSAISDYMARQQGARFQLGSGSRLT